MVLPAVLALGAQLFMVADSVPVLNVAQVCQGIAQQGGATFQDPAIAQEKKSCIDSEMQVRDQLARTWTSFNPADRVACTAETTTGGESSYTELITCLEMARDVRKLRQAPTAR